jgi:hypothetical protein
MITRILVSVDLCYYCNKLPFYICNYIVDCHFCQLKLSLKTSLDLEKVSLLQIIYLLCMLLCLFIFHWGKNLIVHLLISVNKTRISINICRLASSISFIISSGHQLNFWNSLLNRLKTQKIKWGQVFSLWNTSHTRKTVWLLIIIQNTRFNIIIHIIDNFIAFTMLKHFLQRPVRHTVSNALRKSTIYNKVFSPMKNK